MTGQIAARERHRVTPAGPKDAEVELERLSMWIHDDGGFMQKPNLSNGRTTAIHYASTDLLAVMPVRPPSFRWFAYRAISPAARLNGVGSSWGAGLPAGAVT